MDLRSRKDRQRDERAERIAKIKRGEYREPEPRWEKVQGVDVFDQSGKFLYCATAKFENTATSNTTK